jgi:hypothetical protein
MAYLTPKVIPLEISSPAIRSSLKKFDPGMIFPTDLDTSIWSLPLVHCTSVFPLLAGVLIKLCKEKFTQNIDAHKTNRNEEAKDIFYS